LQTDSTYNGSLRIPYPIQHDLHWPPPTPAEIEELTTTTSLLWFPSPLLRLIFEYAFLKKHQLFVGICVRKDRGLFILRHPWSEKEALQKLRFYSERHDIVASALFTIEVPLRLAIRNKDEPAQGALTPPKFHYTPFLFKA
jgi:hypothetical protein